MAFQTVKVVSSAYTAGDTPATRNLKDKIPLSGDLRRMQITVKVTCDVTVAGPTYLATIPEKTRVLAIIRSLKFLMSSGSEEFLFTRGRHGFAMHSLLNTEKFFNDTMPTVITASADYRGIFILNKIHLDSKNEFLYFDIELADRSEVDSTGNLNYTNVEVAIGFEYYRTRPEFNADYGIETNKVDAQSIVTGGLRESEGLTLGRTLLASFIDGFSNSTVNINKIKLSDSGFVLTEASYYEYLSKHLENTNGLMEFVDFENQTWHVPEAPIEIDHTTKFELDVSSTRDFDFIHLYLR